MENKSDLGLILIIDDEPDIVKFLMLCLSRRGYRIDTTESGEQGIKKIETNNYSLIITDLQMSGESGDSVYNFLRYTLKKLTPIIGMSGTPWLLGISDFDAVLAKPCSIKELLTVIGRFI